MGGGGGASFFIIFVLFGYGSLSLSLNNGMRKKGEDVYIE